VALKYVIKAIELNRSLRSGKNLFLTMSALPL
jgi:hypothetical protein